ncbi:MAG: SGNH/GDSL hydrolase family protein [Gemmatimonadaceae bacterium]
MRSFVRLFAIRTWRFLQAFWLIVGMSVALLLLIESCFRVQATVSERMSGVRPGAAPKGDPQAGQPWFDEFTKEYDATRPQRWKSYVYFGRKPSFTGRYVNIDSAGHRITPQPIAPATPAAKVFFFGGSTMWGTAQRDDHTIAAEAARRLQPLAGAGKRIEVTNFGESGYVTTQELLALMLELRAGNIPDVVVFYDGINDVGTTVQYGAPGIPQNESKRANEFAVGRTLDRASFERGLGKDLRALRFLVGEGFNQLAIVDWLKSKKPKAPLTYVSADVAARGTVGVYAENMRIVEGLAKIHGFTAVYVWQPSVHSTEKTLTPFEARIAKQIEGSDFEHRIQETQRIIPGMLDTAMAGVAPGRFVDASGLFKGDTMSVYVDRIGHNTEASVPRIVDAFWPALQGAVTARVRK